MNPPFRIAISASYTAEPLVAVLSFWAGELEAQFDIRFAAYNQIAQTMLDPAGDFALNTHGVNVLLVRLQDLAQDEARLEESAEYVIDVLREASPRFACPVIFCSDDEALLRPAAGIRGLHILPHSEIDRLYPVARKTDAVTDRIGRIPYTEEWFTALGTMLARRIAALSLTPYKAIAVDCDNTLWDGVCGEDGPGGVQMDAARRKLQEFLLAQREAGMVLCLASKNNAEDVHETFRQHPEMPLRLDHFAASRLNWDPKAVNVAAMAEELGLGLDSFMLLDDSAKECAEMDEAAPEVLALTLPSETAGIPHFLHHVWAFDHLVVTEEDRRRAASYADAREFGRAFHRAHSLEEFMAALQLRVTIGPVLPERMERVAQLTQRTNQFNFTGERLSETQVRELRECLTVEVADRFGEYGLTGAMFLNESGEALVIENFLLSCRVLGRGVEHAMLAFAGGLAARRGFGRIEIRFEETGRNQPAAQFLESLGGARDAQTLRQLKWTPAKSRAGPVPRRESATQHRSIPFERIACELSTTQQIVARIRAATPSAPAGANEFETETERELAKIWMDLLHVSDLKPGDRFFDIGGHSLLAVLLISRVRERFGVELAIDDVYSVTLTLRELGAKVEAGRLTGVAPDEYDAMLAEIEGLSDEEVRALLES